MKTGRPAKANAIYKVGIHNNGGRKYASTLISNRLPSILSYCLLMCFIG